MVMLAVFASLIGAALGLKFKVLILVPAIAIAFAIVVVAGLAHSDGILTVALATVLSAAGLQFGYLLGLSCRYLARADRMRRAAPHAAAR
jgi:hypothetical protein